MIGEWLEPLIEWTGMGSLLCFFVFCILVVIMVKVVFD